MNKLDIILTSVLVLSSFILGLVFNPINIKINYPNTTAQGYFFQGTTEPQFIYGDWVCVNVENMSYERCTEVVRHECSHELFSECGESEDIDFCINQYKNENKRRTNFEGRN